MSQRFDGGVWRANGDSLQLNGRSTGVVVGGLGLEYSLTDQAALTLELDGLGQAGKKAAPAYVGAGVRWAF